MSLLNVKKGKAGETVPATSEPQSMDKLKAALQDAKINVDIDAVQREYDEKMRRREEARLHAEEDLKSRQEIQQLNQETAQDLVKQGTLLVCIDGTRIATADVRCKCGEQLPEAMEALSMFGMMWRETADKECFAGGGHLASAGWTTMEVYNAREKCTRCQDRTHVYAQFVLEL